ncbi:hypothetical protein SAMN05443245_5874 [Paraburkholderia fungorum]|uniref:Uncharacterized protein n=1 Tax=Paraburkholderia fungorum TaxID=134537 RepID=A0A1H1IY72_9BURK|nr:hypothetical protein [Paraburkholderia fungorum]SDR42675.1 hypothetical protein SAMN05443245_5874 [Paraburkholderia fungorum]
MNAQTTAVEVVTTSPVIAKYETMTPRALMKAAHKAAENWTQSSYDLGAVLSRIKTRIDGEKDKNFGYDSFGAFVDKELKIKVAQANNFVYVFRTLEKKGIPYEKVGKVSFSVLRAAVDALTIENMDEVVPQLETSTYKDAVENFKVVKDQAKADAGKKSAAAKKAKATPAADDAQDVTFTETTASGPGYSQSNIDAWAEQVTVPELAAMFNALNVNKLIAAFNASGKKEYKLVKLGTPGPKKGSTKTVAAA